MISLEQLQSTIDTTDSPNKEVHTRTWQLLHHAIQPWPKLGLHGGVIAWPLFISDDYTSLLQEGDWIARMLFLHYSVGMRLLCNRWYVGDWGRRLVLATLEPLDEIPSQWIDTISWIRRGVGIDD